MWRKLCSYACLGQPESRPLPTQEVNDTTTAESVAQDDDRRPCIVDPAPAPASKENIKRLISPDQDAYFKIAMFLHDTEDLLNLRAVSKASVAAFNGLNMALILKERYGDSALNRLAKHGKITSEDGRHLLWEYSQARDRRVRLKSACSPFYHHMITPPKPGEMTSNFTPCLRSLAPMSDIFRPHLQLRHWVKVAGSWPTERVTVKDVEPGCYTVRGRLWYSGSPVYTSDYSVVMREIKALQNGKLCQLPPENAPDPPRDVPKNGLADILFAMVDVAIICVPGDTGTRRTVKLDVPGNAGQIQTLPVHPAWYFDKYLLLRKDVPLCEFDDPFWGFVWRRLGGRGVLQLRIPTTTRSTWI